VQGLDLLNCPKQGNKIGIEKKQLMKIKLIQIGKTDAAYLIEGIEKYNSRIKRYHPYQALTIPDIKNSKNLSQAQQKSLEAIQILKNIQNTDIVVLLDEKGKEFNSVSFAKFIEDTMLQSVKQLVFVIGGPYGFDASVYQRANRKIALSKMTFSHQLVRLIFAEQLYRANSIIKGEPYHHE